MQVDNDITIKKTVAIWNRELSISPKDIFFSLGKAAVSGLVLDTKGVIENLLDIGRNIAIPNLPAHAAWLLLYRSLLQSLSELIKEYDEFFITDISEQKQQCLAAELEEALNNIEVGIEVSFFDHPDKLSLLEDIKTPLIRWLTSLGLSEAPTNSLFLRLKERFVLALHQQWLKDLDNYKCIYDAVKSPFVKATSSQRGWMQYRLWLRDQPKKPMFAENFSLDQVYIPLRAYYNISNKEKNNYNIGEPEQTKRVLVDLHTELETWVRNFSPELAVRIICGGPGSGKSSFGRRFAAFVAREMEEIPVILVPLHLFDPSSDLVSAMEQFVKEERFLSGSPLDASEGKERLLIIFDGLDELVMQGNAATEMAHIFVDKVLTKVNKANEQGFKHQVLITGRDIAVQSSSSLLYEEGQILHIQPYIIDWSRKYIDDNGLLYTDQRKLWWEKYGIAKGLFYSNLPSELDIKQLMPLTREPLLNYLVALSYESNRIIFSPQTKLNTIYEDLLHEVHKRQWAHGRHIGSKYLNIAEFIQVLEEIAVTIWHHESRTATIGQIYNRCKKNNLDHCFEVFQGSAQKGISRLLTSFYFRKSKHFDVGEQTFEFTHKSFGEYLTARRITRMVKQFHNELKLNYDNHNSGLNESEALRLWLDLCGPRAMDDYLFQFLLDEVISFFDNPEEHQDTLAMLLSFSAKNGMPVNSTNSLTFRELMRQSRNAEEALLCVYVACAAKTQKVKKIKWGEKSTAFGEWYNRLRGQRLNSEDIFVAKHLAFLDLYGCCLTYCDLYRANLQGANLENANLKGANLQWAFFQGANLQNANLIGANLGSAFIRGANFQGANLRGANLRGLNDANTRGDLLSRGVFYKRSNNVETNLSEVNLQGANLRGANLSTVNLRGANLKDADIKAAQFRKSDIRDVNFEGCDIKKANFKGAIR
ncbi:MAG: pentapeptide repeat-containing protein [Bacteroidetes bacterium]|nr:pentapeptide repeat-containing protein [Bacteroidota bacterium]